MRAKLLAAVIMALVLSAPSGASAQIGIAGRVGTIGLGGDLGIGLSPNLMVRGGVGIQPINPTATVSDIKFSLNLPSSFMLAGLAFFPAGGGLRLEGGVLYKPDDTTLEGTYTTDQTIGGNTYTPAQIGTLSGRAAAAKSLAPYAMLGFGKIASKGIGLFLDLGAAFTGDQTLTVTSNGQYANNAQFKADLEQERKKWEDDLNKYKVYPIVNLGLRIGVGD
jgi:hypothetical protein